MIGCIGLKNLQGTRAEYWSYIGEKQHWGRGFGRQMLDLGEQEARARGFEVIDLVIGKSNERSVGLHRREGYDIVGETPDGECYLMTKRIGNRNG